MREIIRLAVGTCVLAAMVAGCGDDDAMPRPDSGPGDGGVDSGGDAMVETDGGSDAAMLPEHCSTDADCASGWCVNLLESFGLETGYCAPDCATDADCDAIADGRDHRCLLVAERSVCVRTCANGFGCPETDVCLWDWPIPGGAPADVCVDLSAEACTGDSMCAADEYCMPIAADRERLHVDCFAPRGALGTPRTLLRVGAACDPRSDVNGPFALPCASASQCPTGWSCNPRQPDGQRVCTAPDDQTCAMACLPEGVCQGVCATDADCGAGMKCSMLDVAVINHGTPAIYDDVVQRIGLCQYGAGSNAACARESDCATTGAGGARETCVWLTDATGALVGACMTPVAGDGLPGDACGDDPATPAFDFRACMAHACIGGECAAACSGDVDCAAGSTCVDVFVDADTTAGHCIRTETCAIDSDCGAGEICTADGSAEGTITQCAPARGPLAAGAACTLGDPRFAAEASRCATRCIFTGEPQGRCTTACGADTDCPTDFVCSAFTDGVTNLGTADRSDDVTFVSRTCSFVPGSRTACTRSADCPAGESCLDVPNASGAHVRVCTTHNASGAAPGESCTMTACLARYSCLSDWFDPSNRYCSAICVSDADCPSGLVCRNFTGLEDGTLVPLCLTPEDPRGAPL